MTGVAGHFFPARAARYKHKLWQLHLRQQFPLPGSCLRSCFHAQTATHAGAGRVLSLPALLTAPAAAVSSATCLQLRDRVLRMAGAPASPSVSPLQPSLAGAGCWTASSPPSPSASAAVSSARNLSVPAGSTPSVCWAGALAGTCTSCLWADSLVASARGVLSHTMRRPPSCLLPSGEGVSAEQPGSDESMRGRVPVQHNGHMQGS